MPLAAHINATNRCNLNCHYCYAKEAAYDSEEMNMQEMKNVLDKLYNAGVFYATWSGGEPYMNEDFSKILSYSLQLGMVNTVLTNLTMPERIDNETIYHKNCDIQVGLNGIWDNEREKNDVLIQVMCNFKYLQDKGAKMIATIMIDYNEIDIESLMDFLYRYGVKHIRVGLLIKQGKMKDFTELENYKQHIIKTTKKLMDLREKYPNMRIILQSEYLPYEQGLFSRRMELCEAGTSQIYVYSNGDVYPCPLFKNEKSSYCGNILSDSMKEIWHCEVMEHMRSPDLLCTECRKCDSLCGVWCRGLVFSYTNDMSARSPFCLKMNHV